MLRESIGNTCIPAKYTEVVMKCLWKVIRSLSNNDWMADLKVDIVLADLHDFLRAHPTSYWKAQGGSSIALNVVSPLFKFLF